MSSEWYRKTHYENRQRVIDRYRGAHNDGFTFGNVDSTHFGVYLTGIRIGGTPERDVSFETVAGRNGDLIIDNQRWKNIDVTYSCAIATDFSGAFDSFKARLLSQSGYQELTDTIYPDVYRMAVLRQPINPDTMRYNRTGRFDITFTCKPQRFLKYGAEYTHLTEAATLVNDYGQTAKPLITVYGTGPGTLTVGGITVDIKTLVDQITLDCDLMNAFRQVGDAPAENKNSDIYAPEFPELRPGDNTVSWTGNITHVDILPRWWKL